MDLQSICKKEDTYNFKLYLKNKGKINVMATSWINCPLLFYLSYLGNHNKMINYMIKSNAIINVIFKKNTPLVFANWYTNKQNVIFLIKCGGNIFYRNHYGITVIFDLKYDKTEYVYFDLYLQILI